MFATPDLEETAAWLAAETGVTPSPGGPHVGVGTRNELCSFGDGSYLEIIGPDPDQVEPAAPRPFGIDALRQPGVVTWCARRGDIAGLMQTAAGLGLPYTGPVAMSREAPGGLLSWELALPEFDNPGGLVPFFIDWGETPHPSATAAPGLKVGRFRGTHPEPQEMTHVLQRLGEPVDLRPGPAALDVRLDGPGGAVSLPVAGFA